MKPISLMREHDLIVVTKNPDDFEELHRRHPDHPGGFAVYQDNDPRDMTDADIGRSVQNLVAAGTPIAGGFHIFNRWRYC